jgi:DNA-binding LytR/AlgR family response regulator
MSQPDGTMRVLMVDDEPLAQTALANILSARSDVEHFDSAKDVIEALEKLATDAYDVLLLAINTQDWSGTELVGELRKRNFPLPSIVLVTAHVEHAVAAFERHTVDYVLKPFSNESINEALDRAARRAKGERAAKLIEALPPLQKLSRPDHPMIAIKAKGGFSSSILAMWLRFKLRAIMCRCSGNPTPISCASQSRGWQKS